MKKIFIFLSCACIIAMLVPFSAAAENSEIVTDGIDTITITETVEDNVPGIDTEYQPEPTESLPPLDTATIIPSDSNTVADPQTIPSLTSRVYEFWEIYRTEIISAFGSGLLLIGSFLIKYLNDKKTRLIASNVLTIKKDTQKNVSAQADVVGVVNDLVEEFNKLSNEYNKLKKAYEEYGSAEDERNRVVGALVAQNTAILEILTTVYVNSKNLPQGVKDLVSIKYANCLKSLNDDTQLKAIIVAVRDNIGGNVQIVPKEE